MTKKKLIKAIATETNITQKDVIAVLDTLKAVVVDTVQNGKDVKIADFVNFSVKEVPERSGITQLGENKGKKWVKPTHKEVKVKLSKSVKTCLEG